MNPLSFFKLKNKDGLLVEELEVCDAYARSIIPTKTSQLENDSGFTSFSGNYEDLTNKPTIPTKTSQLQNDSGFTTFSGDYADLTNKPTIPTKTSQLQNDSGFTTFSGDYTDLTNKPTIPVVASSFANPFNKMTLGDKAVIYGVTAASTVSINTQYVSGVSYFADVTIPIPEAIRLSAVSNAIVQTNNPLGAVTVDLLSVTTSQIKVRLFSPKSEDVNLGFSVLLFGNN